MHVDGNSSSRSGAKLVALGCVVVASTVLVAILRRYEPTASSYYPKCAFYQITGLHCPGCGGTRAVSSLCHGNFLGAVENNPLLILGGPIIFALLLRQRHRERHGGALAPRLGWSIVLVVSLFFVARNIPTPDRSWFAPPASPSAKFK